MPAPVIPVFISSTWLDLIPEHGAAETAVQTLRETKYVGMKHFGSRAETTHDASLAEVDNSEVYVGIFAGRYGSGITEAEYRRARERNLPCFIYFKRDHAVPARWRENDPARVSKLDALKRELRAAHTVTEFDTPQELEAKVIGALHRWVFDNFLTPKLEGALRGDLPHTEAQALLDAVKDLSALNRDLLSQLQGTGFHVYVAGDLVLGDKVVNVYQAPAVAVAALHQLPPPPRDFTGREEELGELLAALGRGGVAALQGLGGVGKTALALKLAEQLKASYPDAQFYLDLKGASPQPLSAAAALAHVVRAYHPTAKLPEDEAQLRALYLSLLDGRRALLLMDNAAGGEQVGPLEPPAGCVMLVTSRRHFALPGLFAKSLDTLPPDDARRLLLRIAPRIGERAGEIAELCDYLPLAMRMAAGALAERVNLRPEDYVRRLSDAQKRLDLVEASLGLSYDLLSPDLQRHWRALAVFPDTFDTAAAAFMWGADEDAALDTLAELIRYSLVEWDETAGRYHLHDLARLFADERLAGADRHASLSRHAAYFLKVIRAAVELYKRGGESVKRALVLFDLEWENIRAGQSWAAARYAADEVAATLCNVYPHALHLLTLRRHPRESIAWLEAALAAARQLKDRVMEGVHLGNLGMLYSDSGEYRRAVGFYEQGLAIDREVGNRQGEASSLINLGSAYQTLGEPRRAGELYERALIIFRELGDRRGEASALYNLGADYAGAGEPRQATEFYQQHLAIMRELGDRHGEGLAFARLGGAHYELGELQRAVEFYGQALDIQRELGDRRGEGATLGNLGITYARLGEMERAVGLYEQRLAIAREVGDRRGESIVLGSLGNAYAARGELQKAREFYEQQLIITRQLGFRQVEGSANFNIGRVFKRLGDRARALAHAEAALEIFEQVQSPRAAQARAQVAELRAGASGQGEA
jgi:tetratricopeptide (TPR) repeat protein